MRWRPFGKQVDYAIVFSLLILAALALASVAAPSLGVADPNAQAISKRLKAPGEAEGSPLGTDQLGRDVLSRIVHGSRVSGLVAVTAVALAGTIGVALGALAGYYGGRVDDVVSWLVNVQLSFPFILLALAVIAAFGGGLRNIILVLGMTSWVGYARVARVQVLALRDREFVQAARVLGQSHARIIWRHILPNVVGPLIVVATFEMAKMIQLEAALGFLGLGVEPSVPSWGNMLADGRTYINVAWWLATFPGLAITLTVLSINLIGDWLRIRLDPKSRV